MNFIETIYTNSLLDPYSDNVFMEATNAKNKYINRVEKQIEQIKTTNSKLRENTQTLVSGNKEWLTKTASKLKISDLDMDTLKYNIPSFWKGIPILLGVSIPKLNTEEVIKLSSQDYRTKYYKPLINKFGNIANSTAIMSGRTQQTVMKKSNASQIYARAIKFCNNYEKYVSEVVKSNTDIMNTLNTLRGELSNITEHTLIEDSVYHIDGIMLEALTTNDVVKGDVDDTTIQEDNINTKALAVYKWSKDALYVNKQKIKALDSIYDTCIKLMERMLRLKTKKNKRV